MAYTNYPYRYGPVGNLNNLQDRPVPLFSLDETDVSDLKMIHQKAKFCVVGCFVSIPGYLIGIIMLIVGILTFAICSDTTPVNHTLTSGLLAMLILGAFFFVSTIIVRVIRLWFEWKIAKKNNVLLKYYQKLDNSIVSRYMFACQKNPYILWSILIGVFWGTIIDFWLIKETKRILNLPKLTQEEEYKKQEKWIQEFVKINSTDPRIQQAYFNYMRNNNLSPNQDFFTNMDVQQQINHMQNELKQKQENLSDEKRLKEDNQEEKSSQ